MKPDSNPDPISIVLLVAVLLTLSLLASLDSIGDSCGIGVLVLAFSPTAYVGTKTILPVLRSRSICRSVARRMSIANRTEFPSLQFSTSAVLDSETEKAGPRSFPFDGAPTLLQRRLYERHNIPLSGATLVWDDDEVDVDQEQEDAKEEKKEDPGGDENEEKSVVEIKTLVWEVQAIVEDEFARESKSSTQKFYVVTALQTHDKIDTANLKYLIRETRTTAGHRPVKSIRSMQLAPLKIAEGLTGFRSGCMPPICHTNGDMDLYVDRSIVDRYNNLVGTAGAYEGQNSAFASIGSGILGKSLLLPLREFLRVAGLDVDDSEKSGVGIGLRANKYAGSCFASPITTQSASLQGREFVGTEDVVDDLGANKADVGVSQASENDLKMMSGTEIRKMKQEERKLQREAKKDRLKEYRSFKKDDYVSKAKLFRTTARKKGRVPELEELIQETLATGDFRKLMEIPDDPKLRVVDKNALHICAWRGDIESVVRLVEVSNAHYPDMDVVNIVSKGPGNYGKSPIFYALTQCRDDVVRYLVQEAGADLLIVNNKGQTPCSIAPTHVSEETCQLMFQAEAKQLEARGRSCELGSELFANYRASHSDNKLYGDLDPRIPIDDDNRYFTEASRKSEEETVMRRKQNKKCKKGGYDPKAFLTSYMDRTDDLAGQIQDYEESVKLAPSTTLIHGVPTQFSPRALRPTIRWWNRDDLLLAKAHDDTSFGDETTTAKSISRSKGKDFTISKVKNNDIDKSSHDRMVPRFSEVDIDSLDLITIDNILEATCDKENSSFEINKIIVDNAHTLRLFGEEVDSCIRLLNQDLEENSNDEQNILLKHVWGVDCEWKPGPDCGEESPVSTLQLGTRTKAFLVDLQTICRNQDDFTEANTLESELDRVLTKLLRNPNIILAGYGVLQDLGKLAASFPQMECFSEFAAVTDLQSISSVVYNTKFDRKAMSSLQKMTALLLKKRLDKVQQVSDWTRRPLSQEQISYALLDAAIIPVLLTALFDNNPVIEGYNGRFFNSHKNLLSTVRFLPVEPCEDGYAYEIAYGSIKSTLGKAFARQSWPTRMKLGPPEPPKLVQMQVNSKEHSSTPSKKERAHLRKLGADAEGNIPKRPKPIPLKSLTGNLDNLPIPGISLGYTKESCAFRVVGHEVFKTIPEGTYIGFNRRAGVAETSNAWIVFCNFGGDKVFSEFSDNGRKLLFRVNSASQSGRSSEASMYREMISFSPPSSTQENDESKLILLFARESTRTKYLYCGLCTCIEVISLDENTAGLVLQLEDYEKLMDNELRRSSDFENLVRASQR